MAIYLFLLLLLLEALFLLADALAGSYLYPYFCVSLYIYYFTIFTLYNRMFAQSNKENREVGAIATSPGLGANNERYCVGALDSSWMDSY